MSAAATGGAAEQHHRGDAPGPERRPVSARSVIAAAKEAVKTVDLADRLCGAGQLRRRGSEWVGRCPLPDHDDKTPSFVVYPSTDSFYCFGCQRGGDVVDLARYAWGYERSAVAMAAADLLQEFGYEIPTRPVSWYRKNRRQRPARDALEAARLRSVQRRVFRIFAPLIESIEDEEEKREEARHLWDEAGRIARCIRAERGA